MFSFTQQQQPSTQQSGTPQTGLTGLSGALVPLNTATPSTASTSGGLFGQPSTTGMFGSSGSLFGSSSNTSAAFKPATSGTTGTGSSIFGTSGFGTTSTAPSTGLFGTGSAGGTSTFGNPLQASSSGTLFGGPSGSLFGGAASQPFGSSQQSQTTGSGSLFGGGGTTTAQTATALFGAPLTAATSSQPTTSTGLFGSQPTSSSIFGSGGGGGGLFGTTPSSGTTSGSAFGTTSGGLFGGGISAMTTGTGSPAFTTTTETDGAMTTILQSITAMPAYKSKSFEELRLEDYAKGKKAPGYGPPTMSTSTSTSAFGAGTQNPFTFSSPAGTSTTSTLFGSTPTSITSSTGLFGQSMTTQTPLSTAPTFGTSLFQPQPQPQQQPSLGIFGQPQTQTTGTGLFGQSPPAAPKTTSLFGGTGFGSQTTTIPNPMPAFGQQPPSSVPTLGGFGNDSGLFGQSTQQQQPGFGGLFGSQQQPAKEGSGIALFNTLSQPSTSTSSLFKSPTTTLGSGTVFGQPAQPTSTLTPFGGGFGTVAPSTATTGLGSISTTPNPFLPSGTTGAPSGGGFTFPTTIGGSSTTQLGTMAAPSSFPFGLTTPQKPVTSAWPSTQPSATMSAPLTPFTQPFTLPTPSVSTAATQPSGPGGWPLSTTTTFTTPSATLTPTIASISDKSSYGKHPWLDKPLTLLHDQQTSSLPTASTMSLNGVNKSLSMNGLTSTLSGSFPQHPSLLRLSTTVKPTMLFKKSTHAQEKIRDENSLQQGLTIRRNIKKLVIEPKSPSNATDGLIRTTFPISEKHSGYPSSEALESESKLSGTSYPFASSLASPKVSKNLGMLEPLEELEIEDLNNDGYFISPSLETLIQKYKLKDIPGGLVTIGRRGVGQIRFLKPIDLVHLLNEDEASSVEKDSPKGHLEKILKDRLVGESGILQIENQQVSLYLNFDEETLGSKKPEPGHGLNVYSRVTLENCRPVLHHESISGSESEEEEEPIVEISEGQYAVFRERLKRVKGTIFVDYDEKSGRWTFEVSHYSRFHS